MPTLLEAIDKKYVRDGCDNFEFDLPVEIIYKPKRSPRHSIPSLLVLNDCDIDAAGEEEELVEKCQVVEELDLAQNKLSRWEEVFNILKHMPRLKFVNLSCNNLREEYRLITKQNFIPFLKNLVLNRTQVDWLTVKHLLSLLPSLEELHLSLNNYYQVDLDDETNFAGANLEQHTNMKVLHFTGNPVSSWCEVCKLGRMFPCLETLIVAECPLQSLDTHQDNKAMEQENNCLVGRTESESESNESVDSSAHSCFRQLHLLNLNNTLITTWDDIDRLSRFPSLQCLRIQGCPLFEEFTEHERRQFLIARLGNVETLNGGGVIKEEEREDAERAFIRYYMDKPESDRPERYIDLLAIHGKLDPLVQVDLSPEKKVKVTFICGQISEVRNIVVYQTVQDLKHKLEIFSGIPTSKIRLFYVDQDLKALLGPEEMRFPNKQLYSYNIASGDEIIIDSKP